jgi:[pyruvate, water dikinase]-phosphate phosphotransferase / [pyruvate, water dikinase] kinase
VADGWAGLKSGSRANRIFVVSDGTGRTADQALSAALVQFPGAPVEIIVRAKVRTKARAREAVREAAEAGGFIVHTIVTDGVREAIVRAGRERNVEMIDLMGPLIARLTETLAVSPAARPGLFAQLNKSYFRRIETMEFAFRHDDGQRVEDLRKAEIVLLGVSRTFKTPLSIYFAFKGWFVANVPITLEHEPPAILAKLPPRRVFCLDTNARQLAELRRTRHDYLKGVVDGYADPEYVRIELMHARQFYGRHPGWTVINVTNKPIEEIATEILAIRGKAGRPSPHDFF